MGFKAIDEDLSAEDLKMAKLANLLRGTSHTTGTKPHM
jgi:hypothetical protein